MQGIGVCRVAFVGLLLSSGMQAGEVVDQPKALGNRWETVQDLRDQQGIQQPIASQGDSSIVTVERERQQVPVLQRPRGMVMQLLSRWCLCRVQREDASTSTDAVSGSSLSPVGRSLHTPDSDTLGESDQGSELFEISPLSSPSLGKSGDGLKFESDSPEHPRAPYPSLRSFFSVDC